eukprot:Skav228278  [mRNA]  locus=scaffold1313:3643:4197:+ [translate_table: standard]
MGGGFMKTKKHMTKNEAMNRLKARVVDTICLTEATETPPETGALPGGIQTYMETFKKLEEDIGLARTSGHDIVKACLRQTTAEKLKLATSILEGKGRKVNEERVAKIISLIFPPMIDLEASIGALEWKQKELMSTMLHAYCDKYGIYKDGVATLGCDEFKGHIKAELERRDDGTVQDVRGCQIS